MHIKGTSGCGKITEEETIQIYKNKNYNAIFTTSHLKNKIYERNEISKIINSYKHESLVSNSIDLVKLALILKKEQKTIEKKATAKAKVKTSTPKVRGGGGLRGPLGGFGGGGVGGPFGKMD